MGIQARGPENNAGERGALGMFTRNDTGGEPPEPEGALDPGIGAGAAQVSVIEVSAAIPVWRWDVPGIIEPMSVS